MHLLHLLEKFLGAPPAKAIPSHFWTMVRGLLFDDSKRAPGTIHGIPLWCHQPPCHYHGVEVSWLHVRAGLQGSKDVTMARQYVI